VLLELLRAQAANQELEAKLSATVKAETANLAQLVEQSKAELDEAEARAREMSEAEFGAAQSSVDAMAEDFLASLQRDREAIEADQADLAAFEAQAAQDRNALLWHGNLYRPTVTAKPGDKLNRGVSSFKTPKSIVLKDAAERAAAAAKEAEAVAAVAREAGGGTTGGLAYAALGLGASLIGTTFVSGGGGVTGPQVAIVALCASALGFQLWLQRTKKNE